MLQAVSQQVSPVESVAVFNSLVTLTDSRYYLQSYNSVSDIESRKTGTLIDKLLCLIPGRLVFLSHLAPL